MQASTNQLVAEIKKSDPVVCCCRHLRNAVSHRAGAEHGDTVDYCRVKLVTDFASIQGGITGAGSAVLALEPVRRGGHKFDYFQRETLYYTHKEKGYWRARPARSSRRARTP